MKELLLIAGHGQGDSGAVGNGFSEANLTREVIMLMEPYLKEYGIDYDTYGLVTKDNPTGKNMYKNGDAKNYTDYKQIMEVHFNSSTPSSSGIGTEVLIHQDYINIPDNFDKAILTTLGKYWKNRGFKGRSDLANMNTYRRLKKSYRLIEVCFISDSKDMEIYKNNKQLLAKDMSADIAKFFNKNITSPTPPPVDPEKPTKPVTPNDDKTYIVKNGTKIGHVEFY